ncbi:MAG: hypothetical protein H6998_17505 [Hahellaceae bacterium]|nr:hypothetical protein [Hahellaceae bacterium]
MNEKASEPNTVQVKKEITVSVRRTNVILALLFGAIAIASTMIPFWTASRMGITG